MRSLAFASFAFMLLLSSLPGDARAQQSASRQPVPLATALPRAVLASGAVSSVGTGWQLRGTIGQPLINLVSRTGLQMSQGFWPPSFKTPTDADGPRAEAHIDGFRLGAWPNPFSSTTRLQYAVDRTSDIDLLVCDIRGRVVRRILEGERMTGMWTAAWDGTDDAGAVLPPGVYLLRMTVTPLSDPRASVHADKPVMLVR
jgi:hypothetical protein